jgi:GR25 family glycosyltransferase involved in LPS biosynthesis
MIPVIVINLPRSRDRRDYAQAQMEALGIPFVFFKAIDGGLLTDEEKARYEPTMPIGAMGCAESHLAVLREIAAGSYEFVCVLEDDAELSPAAVQLLDEAALRRLGPLDVLRLESRPRRNRRLTIPMGAFDGFSVSAGYRHHMATTGQIFSREGARKIIAGLSYLRVAIDVALFLDINVFGLRVIEARPSLVRPRNTLPSTIGQGRKPPYAWWETALQKHMRIRELRGLLSFAAAWGLPGLLRARLSAD